MTDNEAIKVIDAIMNSIPLTHESKNALIYCKDVLRTHNNECVCKEGDITAIKLCNELYFNEPCMYEVIERRSNCYVNVSRCKKCGKIDIEWSKDINNISEPVNPSPENDDLYKI